LITQSKEVILKVNSYKWFIIGGIVLLIIISISFRIGKTLGNSTSSREWKKEREVLLDSAERITQKSQERIELLQRQNNILMMSMFYLDEKYDSLEKMQKKVVTRYIPLGLSNVEVANLAIEEYEKATGDIISDK
jgi:hypothetical protein